MVKLDDGTIRHFTIRELARLQGFPGDYQFDPTFSKATEQLGNACPPIMTQSWLAELLSENDGAENLAENGEAEIRPSRCHSHWQGERATRSLSDRKIQ